MDNVYPQRKVWTIGEKKYTQEPLGLDRTGRLFSVIGVVIDSLAESGMLELVFTMDTSSGSDMFKLLGSILRVAPHLATQLICICLDVENDEDAAYVSKFCSPRLAAQIALEFVKQNDIKGLKDDFLQLQSLVSQEISNEPKAPKKERKNTTA